MSDKASASRLTLTVDRKGDVIVVRCNGRLVAGVSDLFYRKVSDLIPGPQRIVLDFTELTHMDSTGIGVLVRMYVSAKSAGCMLELMNVGTSVRQLLGITHVLSVFQTIGENNIKMG
ncbi:MAG: STAS domain-containing protein [Candidatus Korobacteraceae bacterium]|jgi:anti-anti-sigma factor